MDEGSLYEVVYDLYSGRPIPAISDDTRTRIITEIKNRNANTATNLIVKAINVPAEKYRDAWFVVLNLLREGLHISMMEISIALIKSDLSYIKYYFNLYPDTVNHKVFGINRESALELLVRNSSYENEESRLPAITYLVDIGADINDGSLLHAVYNLCPGIAKLLMEYGASSTNDNEYAHAQYIFKSRECTLQPCEAIDKMRKLIM